MIRGDVDRRQLCDAVRSIASIRFCDTVNALATTVTQGPIDIVLAELVDCRGVPARQALADLMQKRPALRVCLYISFVHDDVRDAVTIAAATGIRDLIVRGSPDVGTTIASLLSEQAHGGAATRIMTALGARGGSHLAPFIRFCANEASRPITVADAAIAAALPVRTLERHLHLAGLPAPHQFIAWCRVLHVAWWLSESRHPLKQIARDLGFQSVPALYAMTRRYVGCTPTAIRDAGGVDGLARDLDRFLFDRTAAPK